MVGASEMFGGVAGWCVIIRFGAVERRDVVDCAWRAVRICGGEGWMGWSRSLVSRFFPPNKAPSPPPLVLGLAGSGSTPVLGDVGLRPGANASFSLPTGDGDTPRLFAATSMVFACRIEASSAEATESRGVASVVGPTESSVSEAMRGEDSVKSPACDWCGEMPGLLAGELAAGQLSGAGRMRSVATKNTRQKLGIANGDIAKGASERLTMRRKTRVRVMMRE